MNETLQQINLLKKEAEELQPVKPELEKLFWDKFRLEFNYNSNHMEGNTLTYGHTQILLKTGDVVGKYNIRELQEMKAHDLAWEVVLESAADSEFLLTEKFIREINETILVEPFYKEAITPDGQPTRKRVEPGKYKTLPNSVLLQNGTIFNYPSPEETPALMEEFVNWIRVEDDKHELHPVHFAALVHYRFVRIHPFDDSNGRTSRLLLNFVLVKNGFAPIVIESADKKNYLISLNEADAGDLNAFLNYISNLSLRWQTLYLKAINGESIEGKDDFEKEVGLIKKNYLLKKETASHVEEIEIKNTLQNSIFPLLSEIQKKLSALTEFFLSCSIDVELRKQATNTHLNGFSRQNFDEIKTRINTTLLELRSGAILSVIFNHQSLKTTANKPEISNKTNIEILFNTETYSISFPGSQLNSLKLAYKIDLTQSEIAEIATKLAKNELILIKSNSK